MSELGLWETVKRYLPADRTPLVEAAIRAVENLPGVGKWTPAGPQIEGMMPWEVLWGFPFTFLTDIPSLDLLRREIGARIGSNQKPIPSDWAEVSAAALVRALGARTLQRIEEERHPTPDFHVWWDNELVEMEVTKADSKRSQIERTEAVSRITHAIQSFGRECDIVIHIADIPCEEDWQQVLGVARELEPGSESENPGRWRVRAEVPKRSGNYHVTGGHSDPAPSWWPEVDVVRLFTLNQLVGGPEPARVRPQVRIQIGTPITGYLNSATRKADRFQGSGNVPFVIAVNTMALPGAFEIFARALPEYFKAWPRISGVLLIHGPAFIGLRLGWMWGLIQNPDARNKLPDNMRAKMREGQGTIAYDLRSSTDHSIVTVLSIPPRISG